MILRDPGSRRGGGLLLPRRELILPPAAGRRPRHSKDFGFGGSGQPNFDADQPGFGSQQPGGADAGSFSAAALALQAKTISAHFCDEASGGLVDETTAGLAFTAVNGPTSVAGFDGTARLTAVTGSKRFTSAASAHDMAATYASGGFEVSCFTNFTDTAVNRGVMAQWTGAATSWLLWTDASGGKLTFQGYFPAAVKAAAVVPSLGSFKHTQFYWEPGVGIGLIYDGTTYTTANAGTMTTGTTDFEIGAYGPGVFEVNCAFDLVHIFAPILTAAERTYMAGGGKWPYSDFS